MFSTGIPTQLDLLRDPRLSLGKIMRGMSFGPLKLILFNSIVLEPKKMITVTLKEYCIISHPVKRDEQGQIIEVHGQVMLDYGEEEYRFAQPPFPLYPGEELKKDVTTLTVLPPNKALLLSAIVGFKDEDGVERVPGENWLFEGPGVYKPRKEVEVLSSRSSLMISPNSALLLRALMDFTSKDGKKRVYGEQWLVKEPGAYMLGAYEECVKTVTAYHLDEKHALHVRALRTHTDDFGKRRRHGEEWLITHLDTESHIPSVNEEVVEVTSPIILSSSNYCVVCDPVDENGVPRIGKKMLVRGEKSFFLLPGESLLGGIENVYVLGEEEGIILRAQESFVDGDKNRVAGEEWMLMGPLEYVPPIEVEVLTVRKAIPLSDNEGI
uniref:Major vault protein n=1 Tax=Mesocestoides corti TaxID=53468 RepID=A0A5K3FV97_MESCO